MSLYTYAGMIVAMALVAFMAMGFLVNAGWRMRRTPVETADLFHDSHRPGMSEPTPVKIDWPAMQRRKVR